MSPRTIGPIAGRRQGWRRWRSLASLVGAAVVMAVSLGVAWAAQSNVDGTSSELPVEASERPGRPQWLFSIVDACRTEGCYEGSALLGLPGCFVRKVFHPCSYKSLNGDGDPNDDGASGGEVSGGEASGGGEVGLAIFAVLFAVLTRQAVKGYRDNWRLSFALFLILFLGITVFGLYAIDRTSEIWGSADFVVILFASAFLAGVLSFWTMYMLYLVPIVAGGSLVALVSSAGGSWPEEIRLLLIAATGLAGGVWLYWWREILPERKKELVNKQASTTGSGGDGNPGWG